MKRWLTSRKSLVTILLVALPVATTGRLVLDATWDMNVATGIETEHATCDVPAHDHRICVLILNAPWSLPPVAALVRIGRLDGEASHHPVALRIGFDPDLLRLPRSPPLS